MQDEAVRLVVGLGNPGDSYRHHRHNLGFMVVEELARRLGLTFQSGGPSYLVAAGGGQTERIFLLKPLTYMNRSGRAIGDWSRDTGVSVTGQPSAPAGEPGDEAGAPEAAESPEPMGIRPLVICDDLSLPLGSVRLRPSGSSGGQNGLASVIDHLGGEEFPRLRLGIAPVTWNIDPEDWSEYVLAEFETKERPAAANLVDHAATALEFWVQHGLEPTISRFNLRVRPDPESSV